MDLNILMSIHKRNYDNMMYLCLKALSEGRKSFVQSMRGKLAEIGNCIQVDTVLF